MHRFSFVYVSLGCVIHILFGIVLERSTLKLVQHIVGWMANIIVIKNGCGGWLGDEQHTPW